MEISRKLELGVRNRESALESRPSHGRCGCPSGILTVRPNAYPIGFEKIPDMHGVSKRVLRFLCIIYGLDMLLKMVLEKIKSILWNKISTL